MEATEASGPDHRPPADAAAPAALPTDRPRFTVREFRAETVSAPLAEKTAALLSEVGAAAGAAPGDVALTAWAAVLHRHTGQSALALAVADPDALNAFRPVLLRLDPAAPFASQLAAVRHAANAVVPETAPEPRIAAGPVTPAALRELAPDLCLTLVGLDDVPRLELHFHVGLFRHTTAAWLLDHCRTLLDHAVAEPGARVRELPIQAEGESEDAAVSAAPAWALPVPAGHTSPAPAAPGEDLCARFRATARAHTERTAVTGPSATLTYGRLDAVSDALARTLRTGTGQRVAVLCGHDTGAVVAAWSVLKAGSTYVPLDPRQPDGRLGRLLADADAAVVVCDPGLRARATRLARSARVVPVPALDAAPGSVSDPAPASDAPQPQTEAADPQAVAYLLHTSGSTGKPKAVAQTRGNILAHALTYADRVRLGPGDHLPLLARHTFDAAVMDVYGALLTGATLHVVDPLLPAEDLRATLAATRATHLHCTPTLFRHLLTSLPGTDPAAELATVRTVVLGGEEATEQDLRRFLAAFPATSALVNGLGPTECTLVTQHLATRDDLGGNALPVGHPVDGVRVRLLDADGRPTEVFGELEILSDRVATGYWNQPETTAAVFTTHADGTRSYRTGDLARRRADGALVFCGRKDRQIKIRGYRVEPGEVEAALRGHPTVAEAVLTIDRRTDATRLVAYVTPATAFLPDTEELTRYLTRTQPDYAVPWRIVALERLPLGPTGKVDRAALPAPEETADTEDDAPRTELEQAAAALWCRVLGTSSARLHTNFMAAGGDSLRLLELLSAAKDDLGAEIPLLEFLAAPTIATMVQLIERKN